MQIIVLLNLLQKSEDYKLCLKIDISSLFESILENLSGKK